jgi:hypothetical protein
MELQITTLEMVRPFYCVLCTVIIAADFTYHYLVHIFARTHDISTETKVFKVNILNRNIFDTKGLLEMPNISNMSM